MTATRRIQIIVIFAIIYWNKRESKEMNSSIDFLKNTKACITLPIKDQ